MTVSLSLFPIEVDSARQHKAATEKNVNLRWKHLFWAWFKGKREDVQTNWHKMVILNQRIKAKTKKGQTTKAYIWLVDRYCL